MVFRVILAYPLTSLRGLGKALCLCDVIERSLPSLVSVGTDDFSIGNPRHDFLVSALPTVAELSN